MAYEPGHDSALSRLTYTEHTHKITNKKMITMWKVIIVYINIFMKKHLSMVSHNRII